jgi:hypothetical protein
MHTTVQQGKGSISCDNACGEGGRCLGASCMPRGSHVLCRPRKPDTCAFASPCVQMVRGALHTRCICTSQPPTATVKGCQVLCLTCPSQLSLVAACIPVSTHPLQFLLASPAHLPTRPPAYLFSICTGSISSQMQVAHTVRNCVCYAAQLRLATAC